MQRSLQTIFCLFILTSCALLDAVEVSLTPNTLQLQEGGSAKVSLQVTGGSIKKAGPIKVALQLSRVGSTVHDGVNIDGYPLNEDGQFTVSLTEQRTELTLQSLDDGLLYEEAVWELRIVTADNAGVSAQRNSSSITVNDNDRSVGGGANVGPGIISDPVLNAVEDIQYTYEVKVYDPNDLNNGVDLKWSLSGEPEGMVISKVGVISWTPLEGILSSGPVTVTIEDGGEKSAVPATQTFTVDVRPVNDAPVILYGDDGTPREPVLAIEDQLIEFKFRYFDPDDINDGEQLTWTLYNAPDGMEISKTGLITWTPGEFGASGGSVNNINIELKDNGEDGAEPDVETFSIIILPVNDAPVIVSQPLLTAREGEQYSYQVVVNDPDNSPDEISFALSGHPAAMTISNTGLITWTPTHSDPDPGPITLTVTDTDELSGNGPLSTTQVFDIQLEILPELSVGDLSVNEGAGTAQVQLQLSKPCTQPAGIAVQIGQGGSAEAGSDFNIAVTGVNFAVGEQTAQIAVSIVDDSEVEDDESFTLNFVNPNGLYVLTSSSSVTIIDNDDDNGGGNGGGTGNEVEPFVFSSIKLDAAAQRGVGYDPAIETYYTNARTFKLQGAVSGAVSPITGTVYLTGRKFGMIYEMSFEAASGTFEVDTADAVGVSRKVSEDVYDVSITGYQSADEAQFIRDELNVTLIVDRHGPDFIIVTPFKSTGLNGGRLRVGPTDKEVVVSSDNYDQYRLKRNIIGRDSLSLVMHITDALSGLSEETGDTRARKGKSDDPLDDITLSRLSQDSEIYVYTFPSLHRENGDYNPYIMASDKTGNTAYRGMPYTVLVQDSTSIAINTYMPYTLGYMPNAWQVTINGVEQQVYGFAFRGPATPLKAEPIAFDPNEFSYDWDWYYYTPFTRATLVPAIPYEAEDIYGNTYAGTFEAQEMESADNTERIHRVSELVQQLFYQKEYPDYMGNGLIGIGPDDWDWIDFNNGVYTSTDTIDLDVDVIVPKWKWFSDYTAFDNVYSKMIVEGFAGSEAGGVQGAPISYDLQSFTYPVFQFQTLPFLEAPYVYWAQFAEPVAQSSYYDEIAGNPERSGVINYNSVNEIEITGTTMLVKPSIHDLNAANGMSVEIPGIYPFAEDLDVPWASTERKLEIDYSTYNNLEWTNFELTESLLTVDMSAYAISRLNPGLHNVSLSYCSEYDLTPQVDETTWDATVEVLGDGWLGEIGTATYIHQQDSVHLNASAFSGVGLNVLELTEESQWGLAGAKKTMVLRGAFERQLNDFSVTFTSRENPTRPVPTLAKRVDEHGDELSEYALLQTGASNRYDLEFGIIIPDESLGLYDMELNINGDKIVINAGLLALHFQEVKITDTDIDLDAPPEESISLVNYLHHGVVTPFIAFDETKCTADDESVTLVGKALSTLDHVLNVTADTSDFVVVVEGEEVELDSEGRFTAKVPLDTNEQYVGVTAYNVLGGVATDRLLVDGTAVSHLDSHTPKPVFHRLYLGSESELPGSLLNDRFRLSVVDEFDNIRLSIYVDLESVDGGVYTAPFLVSSRGRVSVEEAINNAQKSALLILENLNDDLHLSHDGHAIAIIEQAGMKCMRGNLSENLALSKGSYHSAQLDENLQAAGATVALQLRNIKTDLLVGTVFNRVEKKDGGSGLTDLNWSIDDNKCLATSSAMTLTFGRQDITAIAEDLNGDPVSYSFSSFIADGESKYRDVLIIPGALSDPYDDVVIIRVPASLSDQTITEVMDRLDCVVVALEEYGPVDSIDTRLLWIHPMGNRDRHDVLTELTSQEIGIHIEYETFSEEGGSPGPTDPNPPPPDTTYTKQAVAQNIDVNLNKCIADPNPPGAGPGGEDFNIVEELKKSYLINKSDIKRLRWKTSDPFRAERRHRLLLARKRKIATRIDIIKRIMEPQNAAGHKYHVIDARVNRDEYRFPSIQRPLFTRKVLAAANPKTVFDDMVEAPPIYLHQTTVDKPDYQVRTYTFQGWDQKRKGVFEPNKTSENGYPRPLRLKMKQDDLGTGGGGLSSLVRPNHKGVIIMLHGYNNGGSIDAADADPVSVFEDGKVTTQLWPHTRHLYHRFIDEAGGKPEDYLFLFVRWTGDWGDNTLTKGGFFSHDYGLAHHAGAFPLTKLMEDLVEAYDAHDPLESRGNNQIDREFMFMIQGNSLGGRVMTSMARGMQNTYQLEQIGENMIVNKDEDEEESKGAFPNHPELRIFFAHSALPSRDFAPDRLGLRRQDERDSNAFKGDDINNESVMSWPNSPLQEEYRGLKLYDNHALCFYSPFDKPGYIFSHRFTIASSDARGEMLGRVGPDPSYAPNAENTIAPICAVHSASGTDFQDLWHVTLMGWNVPGQLFGSRATYTHNDFGNIGIWRGLRKVSALANINSSVRMSEIQEGHIIPIWSRIGRYVVTGNHE